MLADKRAPQQLKDIVVDLLVARKDPASLPVLTDSSPSTTTSCPDRAARARPGREGDRRARRREARSGEQVARRSSRCRATSTHPRPQVADLVFVIDAMAAIGGGAERLALGSHCCSITPMTTSAATRRGGRQSCSRSRITAAPASASCCARSRRIRAPSPDWSRRDPATRSRTTDRLRVSSGHVATARSRSSSAAARSAAIAADRQHSRRCFTIALEAHGVREQTELAWQSCFGRCTQGPERARARGLTAAAGTSLGSGFATLPGPRGATALYNRMDAIACGTCGREHVIGGTNRSRLHRAAWHPPFAASRIKRRKTASHDPRNSHPHCPCSLSALSAGARATRKPSPIRRPRRTSIVPVRTRRRRTSCSESAPGRERLADAREGLRALRDHGRDRRQRADRQAEHRWRPAADRRQGRGEPRPRNSSTSSRSRVARSRSATSRRSRRTPACRPGRSR